MFANVIRAFSSTSHGDCRFDDPAWRAEQRKKAVFRNEPRSDKAMWQANAKRDREALEAKLRAAGGRS